MKKSLNLQIKEKTQPKIRKMPTLSLSEAKTPKDILLEIIQEAITK